MFVAARPVRTTCFAGLLALGLAACGGSPADDSDLPDYAGNLPGNPGVNPGGPAQPATPGDPSSPAPVSQNPEQQPTGAPLDPVQPTGQNGGPQQPPTGQTPPGQTPTDQPPTDPGPTDQPPGNPAPASADRPTAGTANLFTDVLGIPVGDVDDKIKTMVNRIFGIGTNEPTTPVVNQGFRIYYELPQDTSQAFIWCADNNDVRSEGMSYGMMIAVQMNMQTEFNKLWKFADDKMRFRTNDGWNNYFRWQGTVNASANNITVNFAQNGPAPDGESYFAAALYLANRRWGSGGAVNYLAEAQSLSSAMLNNQASGGRDRTPVIDRQSNMVVFFPSNNSATFSDPSYHVPAFYEIFAQDGPQQDSARWRQIAQISRQYFVSSANGNTGLHPDYASFTGPAITGQGAHDQFQYDAWRVMMNMAIDYVWTGPNASLKTQIEKYHSFFSNFTTDAANNVSSSLFRLNGNLGTNTSSNVDDGGGSSTALTAMLATGALASDASNIQLYVDNAWNVGQQSGKFRYYQELVYALGMLASSGWYGYEWSAQ
jgi:oligosaccharide reducing-end xylanase